MSVGFRKSPRWSNRFRSRILKVVLHCFILRFFQFSFLMQQAEQGRHAHQRFGMVTGHAQPFHTALLPVYHGNDLGNFQPFFFQFGNGFEQAFPAGHHIFQEQDFIA